MKKAIKAITLVAFITLFSACAEEDIQVDEVPQDTVLTDGDDFDRDGGQAGGTDY